MLGERPNQIERQRDDVSVTAADLLDVAATPGEVTEAGVRAERLRRHPVHRVLAARQRRGRDQQPDGGRRDRRDLRSQIWQWVRHGRVDAGRVERGRGEEVERLGDAYRPAAELFQQVALDPEFVEFLTLPAYELLP